MIELLRKYKFTIILGILIIGYILYFSFFTILRYRTLYASYYDLGIMNQVVFNTYRAFVEGDVSRIFEMTNTIGPEQIKRMAIHNDLLLGFLALFYFIFADPSTLLVIQAIVVGLGAVFIYLIAVQVFSKNKRKNLLALAVAFSYLLYPPLQRANQFEFHSVTLATTFLLGMFYFWMKKRYVWMFFFLFLSLISKEQIAFTTVFFGFFAFMVSRKRNKELAVIMVSIGWFLFSFLVVIPYFRGSEHFAIEYFSDFGDSPIKVIIGILSNPISVGTYIFSSGAFKYYNSLLGPVGFLSLLSPLHLLIAAPEFAINLLSKNPNMRNIIYHYTAVITPFIFISAIYGVNRLLNSKILKKHQNLFVPVILMYALFSAYKSGPLPFSQKPQIHPFKYPQKEAKEAIFWAKTLKDDHLKISTTGQLAPFFTNRRYFYNFSKYYYLSDYVIVRPKEIYEYPEKKVLTPVYEQLKKDYNYELIYKKDNFEVYKRRK